MLIRLTSFFLVTTILLFPNLALSEKKAPDIGCRQCHIEDMLKDLSQTFIHEPFIKELCHECHLSSNSQELRFSRPADQNPTQEKTSHTNLQNKEFTSLTTCSNCHPEGMGASSHPVNILPPKGMSIPPEYPTLADGRISCMTCHKRHASNIQFRLVKARDKEFCVGCHRSKKRNAAGIKFKCRGKCNKEL